MVENSESYLTEKMATLKSELEQLGSYKQKFYNKAEAILILENIPRKKSLIKDIANLLMIERATQ